MDLEENKQVVRRFNTECIEKGNTDLLKEIVSDDFVNHTVLDDYPDDVSGLAKFIELLHQGFPDIKVVIDEMIAEGDIVATIKSLQGTHQGEIMGHKPTGKKVKMTIMDAFRIKNKQFIGHWTQNDVMQTIQKL